MNGALRLVYGTSARPLGAFAERGYGRARPASPPRASPFAACARAPSPSPARARDRRHLPILPTTCTARPPRDRRALLFTGERAPSFVRRLAGRLTVRLRRVLARWDAPRPPRIRALEVFAVVRGLARCSPGPHDPWSRRGSGEGVRPQPCARDVDLDVLPGEVVAILGPKRRRQEHLLRISVASRARARALALFGTDHTPDARPRRARLLSAFSGTRRWSPEPDASRNLDCSAPLPRRPRRRRITRRPRARASSASGRHARERATPRAPVMACCSALRSRARRSTSRRCFSSTSRSPRSTSPHRAAVGQPAHSRGGRGHRHGHATISRVSGARDARRSAGRRTRRLRREPRSRTRRPARTTTAA